MNSCHCVIDSSTQRPSIASSRFFDSLFCMFQIQRNKRRLAASQQQGKSATTMDQATRAMLAVFVSNLVFGLPHSIYHLMGKQPYYMHVIFHVLFSTHFVVDPLVFVFFNLHNRRRVIDLLSSCRRRVSCQLPPMSSKVVFSPAMTAHTSGHVTKDATP